MNLNLTELKKAIETKEVLRDVATKTYFDETLNCKVLELKGSNKIKKYKMLIPEEEMDLYVNWKNFVRFIGFDVMFVVTEIDKEQGIIFCSRRKAQEIVCPKVLEDLTAGKPKTGIITGILPYGAYVEIDGLYSILKNSDFSDYHIPIHKVLRVGDKIEVKLKEFNEKGKFNVEAVKKYEIENPPKVSDFQKDQVVLGEVSSVKPWGAYVNIAPGLDALCPVPENEDIEIGTKVSFRISVSDPERNKLRGKILRVIPS